MKRILVICTCNRYWNRFAACRQSWARALGNMPETTQDAWYLSVAELNAPKDNNVSPFVPYAVDKQLCTKSGSQVESKSTMIREILLKTGSFRPTHYLFTDADIIVPSSLCSEIEGAPDDAYVVADRVDLNDLETYSLIHGNLDLVPRCDANSKKRGMGWFQMLPANVFLSQIQSKLPWGHPGYDLFDWMVNDLAIKTGMSQYVLPSCFLHLRHGDDGANWKGASQEW